MSISDILYLAALLIIVFGILSFLASYVKNKEMPTDEDHREDDPAPFEDAEDYSRQLEKAVEEAKGWDADKLELITKNHIFGDSSDIPFADDIVLALGEQLHPIVIKILADPALREKLVGRLPCLNNGVPVYPFGLACELFEDCPPLNAAPCILPFMEEQKLRNICIRMIAAIASPDLIPLIGKALQSDFPDFAVSAVFGLKAALDKNRVADEFKSRLFSDLEGLLNKGCVMKELVASLFMLDEKRATKLFLDDKYFNVESAVIYPVLQDLLARKIAVPHEQLEKLVEDGHEFGTCSFATALELLGYCKTRQVREELRPWLESESYEIASGAARGLLCSYGLHDFEEKTRAEFEKDGYQALSKLKRICFSVSTMDSEIRDGGLSQYFSNPCGEQAADVLEGLQEMNSTEILRIFASAMEFWGMDGPPKDYRERRRKIADSISKRELPFEEQTQEYLNSEEFVPVLLCRYLIKNAEEFGVKQD